MIEIEPLLKNLGRCIAKRRKQKGMSQEEFADVSGKMINTISNIERGISDPKVTTLVSIANALDVSLEELFSDCALRQKAVELPEKIRLILKVLEKQDDKTLQVILKQVEAIAELR